MIAFAAAAFATSAAALALASALCRHRYWRWRTLYLATDIVFRLSGQMRVARLMRTYESWSIGLAYAGFAAVAIAAPLAIVSHAVRP